MPYKLPPLPNGVVPGSSYWNDWYERLRTLVNSINSEMEVAENKNTPGGYAGLNSVGRVTQGVDTTDYLIVDESTKGLILKSPNGHYWKETISDVGIVTWTDLGTTKP